MVGRTSKVSKECLLNILNIHKSSIVLNGKVVNPSNKIWETILMESGLQTLMTTKTTSVQIQSSGSDNETEIANKKYFNINLSAETFKQCKPCEYQVKRKRENENIED